MENFDALNRALSRAKWEGCHPGVGTWVLVTRKSRVMTTVAALFAAVLVTLLCSIAL